MKYDKALGQSVYESEKEICKDAMQVQDACNIVAVMHSYTSAVRFLREKNGYEYKYSDHPAIVMFHDKFEDMLRVPFSERTDRLSWAMDECQRTAGAE